MSAISVSEKYIHALSKLVDGSLSPSEFETWFWKAWKAETLIPLDVFPVLDRFCDDVDAYCSIVEIRDEESLDENGLIASAKKTLRELNALSFADHKN